MCSLFMIHSCSFNLFFTPMHCVAKAGDKHGTRVYRICVYLQISTVNGVFLLLFSLSTVLELCTVIVVLEIGVKRDLTTSSCI